MRFTTNDIFTRVKISYFLRVFKYDFSQWPKTLYNTYVYIIKYHICTTELMRVQLSIVYQPIKSWQQYRLINNTCTRWLKRGRY